MVAVIKILYEKNRVFLHHNDEKCPKSINDQCAFCIIGTTMYFNILILCMYVVVVNYVKLSIYHSTM